MTDYVYHEVPVTRGNVVRISDSVNPCHIRLVETDDGPFVKWLEPVVHKSPVIPAPWIIEKELLEHEAYMMDGGR